MSCPLKATEGRVIIKPKSQEEISEGGIVIPPTAKYTPDMGTILHVGPGEYLECGERKEAPCSIGDEVVFAEEMSTCLEHEGEWYYITAYACVLAVMT